MAAKKDYYKTLEIEKNATPEEIKKAYRKQVRKWHPDAYKGSDKKEAENKFKEVQEAYDVLTDPQKKAMYDKFGYVGDTGSYNRQRSAQNFGGGFFDDFFGGGSGVEDIFDVFFGGSRGKSKQRTGPAPMKGGDIHASITLNLKELIEGKKVTLEYDRQVECNACHGTGAENGTSFRTCPTCNGSGSITEEHRSPFGFVTNKRVCSTCEGNGKIIENKCPKCTGKGRIKQNHKVSVTIPAGVENGSTIRLTNHGNAGLNGGQNGNLYISVKTNIPKEFVRSKNDLLFNSSVDYIEAVLGTAIDVPLPEGGTETLKIPSGTNPGQVFRLKNFGVPSVRTGKRGDIIVSIDIKISKPGRKEKKLLKEVASLRKAKIVE